MVFLWLSILKRKIRPIVNLTDDDADKEENGSEYFPEYSIQQYKYKEQQLSAK